MTPPMTPREKAVPSLSDLLRQAVETMKSWTPEQREAHFEAQKKAWVAAEMAFGDEGTRVITALASGSGDHAELARLSDYCRTLANPGDLIVGPNMMRYALEQSAGALEILLAENAALRERLETARIARAAHNRQHGEAERKLAEAVRLLRDVVSPGWTRDAWSKARTFLGEEAETDKL